MVKTSWISPLPLPIHAPYSYGDSAGITPASLLTPILNGDQIRCKCKQNESEMTNNSLRICLKIKDADSRHLLFFATISENN